MFRRVFGSVMVCLTCSSVFGQVIVNDNFDQYLSDADFETAWAPSNPAAGGLLVPRAVAPFPPAPFDGSGDAGVTPPVEPVVGQAVAFNDLAGVNEWTDPFSITPTATEAVRYSADIFDFVQGNRRFSVGLRNASGANIFELGFWNADTFDPTDPLNAPPNDPIIDQPTTAYGYRVILVDGVGGDLVRQPNWQYFPLDPAFDDDTIDHNGDGRVGNADGLVNPVDVGPGWHTFAATIELDRVTLELDLFRDGVVDSVVEWDVTVSSSPFNSLRIGGPSALSMNEFTMVDNVSLALVSLDDMVDGDFNNDGQWDCGDVNSLSDEIAAGTNDASFDLTGDGAVDGQDLAAWLVEGGANNAGVTNGNPFLVGDANLDGNVDGQDFIVWNGNKFTPVGGFCFGDFNADGIVDGQDFVAWNGNKFTSSADAFAVPEPAMAAWLVAAMIGVLRRRR